MQQVTSFLFQTAISTGLAIVGFLVLAPTKFGEHYLDFYFHRRLAAYKAKQDEAIEKIKEGLAFVTDRGRHSNEREFAAMTEAWESFVEAHLRTMQCVIQLISYVDLDRLTEDEVDHYLSTSDFSAIQINRVRNASDKSRTYVGIQRMRNVHIAGQKIFDAKLVLRKRGVFIAKPLRDLMEEKLDVFSKAQAEQSINLDYQGGEPRLNESTRVLMSQGAIIFDEVLTAVRTRLLREV